MSELQDTAIIRKFMEAFGQKVYSIPLTEVPDEIRLLRGRLVLEEALELMAALGLNISLDPDGDPRPVDPKKAKVEIDPERSVDMIETADALVDLNVVGKGSALALGIPVDAILIEEVGPSNMAKLGPDGKPILRADKKVLKPEGWEPPNIDRVLRKAGWEPKRTPAS